VKIPEEPELKDEGESVEEVGGVLRDVVHTERQQNAAQLRMDS
jgi:hypothetical protein